MESVHQKLNDASFAIQDAMILSKGIGGTEADVVASDILGRIAELALHFIRAQSLKERNVHDTQ